MGRTSDGVSYLEKSSAEFASSMFSLEPGHRMGGDRRVAPEPRVKSSLGIELQTSHTREAHFLAGPGLKPYLKAGQTPLFLADGFRWQVREHDCEPTQVFNVLRELSRRHADPTLGLPYAVVSSALPPALEGASWRRAVRTLGNRLPRNYRVFNRIGSPESRWQEVEKILHDEESSLPIIAVSSGYWAEVSDGIRAADNMDHTLVVLAVESGKVIVFDSYAAINSRSTHAKSRSRSVSLSDGIVPVSPVKLIRYWQEAGIPSYLFWVARTGRQTTRQTLLITEPEK